MSEDEQARLKGISLHLLAQVHWKTISAIIVHWGVVTVPQVCIRAQTDFPIELGGNFSLFLSPMANAQLQKISKTTLPINDEMHLLSFAFLHLSCEGFKL